MIGCCLLDVVQVRPSLLVPGVRLRAAAHRISVERDGEVGVYVPARLTSARLVQWAGGRVFPGVHRPATTSVRDDGAGISWVVAPSSPKDYAVRVVATPIGDAGDFCDASAGACLRAEVGWSPGLDGRLEVARMQPAHRDAVRVVIEELTSSFIDSFGSARPATSLLMRDIPVRWSR